VIEIQEVTGVLLRGRCPVDPIPFLSDWKNQGVTSFPCLLDIHQTATENPEFFDFSFIS
jgi:hypothetical protein